MDQRWKDERTEYAGLDVHLHSLSVAEFSRPLTPDREVPDARSPISSVLGVQVQRQSNQ